MASNLPGYPQAGPGAYSDVQAQLQQLSMSGAQNGTQNGAGGYPASAPGYPAAGAAPYMQQGAAQAYGPPGVTPQAASPGSYSAAPGAPPHSYGAPGGGYPAMAPVQQPEHNAHSRPVSATPNFPNLGVPLQGADQHHTYGHLQHAPSFNQRPGSVAGAAAPPAATAPGAMGAAPGAAPAAAAGAWMLPAPLPQQPKAQITGPFLRFNDYDPATGLFAVSVLVVSHPSLGAQGVQVHYGQDAPATMTAPIQLLDEYMGYKFWRADIVLTLRDQPGYCQYMVGLVGGSAPHCTHHFNLPARVETWRCVAYSCNGFHEASTGQKYNGIGYLWKDMLQQHGQKRYHVMIGGGDQLYCDSLFELSYLQPWLKEDDPHHRAQLKFTQEMLQAVEQYYMGRYCEHFSDPDFAQGLAVLPYIFVWDDHDIFDGWGSYPDYLQKSPVFQGIFAVARRFYLLFQHHATYWNAGSISKTLGEFSYHQVRSLGPNMLLLVPDTRSERTTTQIVPPQGWDLLFGEANKRLTAGRGAIQHVLVLLTVPIVYPKIPMSESMLSGLSSMMASSKAMRDAVKKLAGNTDGAVSQFSEPDLLDDLLDHWTSAEHVAERQALVRRLQTVAQTYSARVTFISGDVHCGGFGCFQAHPKQFNRVVDHKYMLQVITSAIGNEPPPPGVISALETSSMASTAMQDTLDKMMKQFPNNKKLMGARNYCEIYQIQQPITDPHTNLQQPAGGLCFNLRVEGGPAGRPTGVEQYHTVAPVLLSNPTAAAAVPNGQFYASQQVDPALAAKKAGIMGAVTGLLPGQTGQAVNKTAKDLGHKLSNFLGKF